MSRITFVSLNIEADKHLDQVVELLQNVNPDVVCLQEVVELHIPRFAQLGYDVVYAPMSHSFYVPESILGLAILTKGALQRVEKNYYVGNDTELPSAEETKRDEHSRVLMHGWYEKEGSTFHVGTTHFPKSWDGETDDRQRAVFKDFLPLLTQHSDFMFSGDFNAPRGKEIFDTIATHFTDNIPAEYETSLDANLHKAGYLPFMVDGLFTTEQYKVEHVRLVDGVSDHMAIVAEIFRA